jgi:predicted transcriptional regulator
MKPTLQMEAYQEMSDMFECFKDYRELIELIGANKRGLDVDTIIRAYPLSAPYVNKALSKLVTSGIVLCRFSPSISGDTVCTNDLYYYIDWKMIKAINKAVSKLWA